MISLLENVEIKYNMFKVIQPFSISSQNKNKLNLFLKKTPSMGKHIIILFFLVIQLQGNVYSQKTDSLSIELNKTLFSQGDTINIEANLKDYLKICKAGTINLWIEEIKTGKKWRYRYPLLNGYLNAQLKIDEHIADGDYAFNFLLQKSFFSLYGAFKNAGKKDSTLRYTLFTKNMQTVLDKVPLDEDKYFYMGGLLFQDSAFIIFSKNGNRGKNVQVDIKTPLDSSYKPAMSATKLIRIGTYSDSIKPSDIIFEKYSFDRDSALYKKMLPTIVLKSKLKKQVDEYEKENVSGLFKSDDAIVLDGLETDQISQAGDLFSYLSSKAAGLTVERDDSGMQFLKWRKHKTEVYVNEIKTDPEEIQGINNSDIAMIKIFRPGTPVSFGSGEGGTIAIYTKVGSYKNPYKTGNTFYILGYSALDMIWK
jgi:hypothetical protein